MNKPLQNNTIFENLGYTQNLCILPFDHRSYFEKLLGFSEPLSSEQVAEITTYKKIIYAGYEKSLELGVRIEDSAILVDDVFGKDILIDALSKKYTVLQSTEVSGIDHFEFEHPDWQERIHTIRPTFVKALVRYNPAGNLTLNKQSLENLELLSSFAHEHGYKFLIEPLIPATPEQLVEVHDNQHSYDTNLRPHLTVQMIHEMYAHGIEPDVWKIEGLFTSNDYALVQQAVTQDGRDHVGIVCLGRNETDETVALWITEGKKVSRVIGFAVGRTVFLDALMEYKNKNMNYDETVVAIAQRFKYFYDIFKK